MSNKHGYYFANNPVELRLNPEGQPNGTYFGTAVVYNANSEILYGQFRERFAPGAFDEHLATNPDIYACAWHDCRMLLGRTSSGTLRIKYDERGVFCDGEFPNTQTANDVRALIARKDIRGMSFAFECVDDTWQKEDGLAQRIVTRARMFEVSFLNDPAYLQTSAGVRSRTDVPHLLEQAARVVRPSRRKYFGRWFEMAALEKQ